MGIGKNIKEIAIEHPDKSAINYEDSIITYGDFYRTICQIQQHLLNINHKKEPQKVADRKSTRLNSSHVAISYAVFCLKKKTTLTHKHRQRGRRIHHHRRRIRR